MFCLIRWFETSADSGPMGKSMLPSSQVQCLTNEFVVAVVRVVHKVAKVAWWSKLAES